MKLLLIDNYDSFTYNLLHYFMELGAAVEVVRNDATTPEAIAADRPDGIVLSPGPGAPDDAGITCDVIRTLGGTTPIFGVCLGHQAIGQVYGGHVERHTPMHGKTSEILHEGRSVFAGLPSPFTATRYHSLIVAHSPIPEALEVTARTADGVIMGLAHRHYPVHGVQFHPESIASEHGHALLRAFLDIVAQGKGGATPT
jgi:anthranilate synthase component 2